MKLHKIDRRKRIKFRIAKVLRGTVSRPRLSVFRSNKEIYAQIIDDVSKTTLVSASSRDKDFDIKGTKIDKARKVGEIIADRAINKGLKLISFDRNGYLYHGRVKSLADGAREKGLQF